MENMRMHVDYEHQHIVSRYWKIAKSNGKKGEVIQVRYA
jgi:uncharacterized protein affecting Mg2+/Co2+ transport